MTTESPGYVHATPGRTFSAIAYTLLARDNWPVYVSTERNYGVYNRTGAPTDPGDTIHASAHFRPVGNWHPLAPNPSYARDGANSWPDAAGYLDDRIRLESVTGNHFGPGTEMNVDFVYDEYFVMVEGPHGSNIAEYGDYGGCTYTASNYRSLLRDYPDTFAEVSYAHGGHALAIPLFVSNEHDDYDTPHYDQGRAEELADVLIGLAYDYPVYDEDDHSQYENELVTAALDDGWLQGRIREGVAGALVNLLSGKLKLTDDFDTYDLTNVLEDYLGEATTFRDPYQSEPGPGCHTVYSLFAQFAGEHGRIIFESAVEPTFLDMEETADEVARYILGEDSGNEPPLPTLAATPDA